MRILFINEVDIFENASAGITIRDLFGEELCEDALVFQIISNRSLRVLIGRKEVAYVENYASSMVRLLKIIRQYGPKAIYTTGFNGKTLVFILTVKTLCGLPVVIHYFDNWREWGNQRLKNALLARIESRRFGALVISEEMKAAYGRRYGRRYQVLMAGNGSPAFPDDAGEEPEDGIDTDQNNEIVIVYAGGLHLSRAKKLLEFERMLVHTAPIRCRLKVYTFDQDRLDHEKEFNREITEFFPAVAYERIHEIYRQADVLLYVEDVNKDNYELIKYSMSSKIPQFLSSKKPIVCFSEPGTATYAYLKRHNACFFIDNADQLRDAALKVQDRDPIVRTLVDNACSAAERDFSVARQRQTMREILRNIAKS